MLQVPLEIAFVNLEPSEAVEARVRDHAAKLERYYERMISCRVTVEVPHRRHRHGDVFDVRIDIGVPGKELVVSRAPGDAGAHTDVYVAIRDSFAAAERQLEDYARQQRGDVKTHPSPLQGRITRLFPDQGYGFIATTDLREVYFHRNSVVEGAFDELAEGQPVELSVAEGESPLGPQATTVRPIAPMRFDPELPKP